MAKASGAKLGALVYLTNQVTESLPLRLNGNNFASLSAGLLKEDRARLVSPIAIEPNKVIRNAAVYAVFAIE
jgi:hypothetical protein